MFLFEGYCDGGTIQVQGLELPTLQEAADSFASNWQTLCGSEFLPNPLTWTADGLDTYAVTNAPYGFVNEMSGANFPGGYGEVEWVASATPPTDPTSPDASLSFLAAVGLVVCYGVGLIAGQQR